MFLDLFEILDIILMTLIVGFLFMKSFMSQKSTADVLDKYLKKTSSFDWSDFWFASMVTAPAIILHEFGHKITGLLLGFSATFHAACSTATIASGGFLDFYCGITILSIILRLVNFGFIFFIPAFVQIGGNPSYIQSSMIAFAGPFVNLLLFIIASLVIKFKGYELSGNAARFWLLTKNINLFLFIFNILPIPGFDGFQVFSGLWHAFGL